MPNSRRQSGVQPSAQQEYHLPSLSSPKPIAAAVLAALGHGDPPRPSSAKGGYVSTPQAPAGARKSSGSLPGPKKARKQSGAASDNELVLHPAGPKQSKPNATVPKKRHTSAGDAHLAKKPKLDASKEHHKKKNSSAAASAPGPTHPDSLRCHQCKAETLPENALSCSNQQRVKTVGRKSESAGNPPDRALAPSLTIAPCRNSYCEKCLLTRYGEELFKLRPTVNARYTWNCPVCKDDCNCSTCRRKKGLAPTGRLSKAATEGGYTSARELLEVNPNAQGSDMLAIAAKKREKEAADASGHSKSASGNKPPKSAKTPKSSKDKPDKSSSKHAPKKSAGKPAQLKGQANQDSKMAKKEAKKEAKKQAKKQAKEAKKEALKQAKKEAKEAQKEAKKEAKRAAKKEAKQAQAKSSEGAPASKTSAKPAAKDQPKVSRQRGPKKVAPPRIRRMPTGWLTSDQIRLRLYVREFVCRFRGLLPSLGGTELRGAKSEGQRAGKVIDSMDDVVNFWVDDEGGMRAIMHGLVWLIDGDVDRDKDAQDDALLSPDNLDLLDQLKRECKLSTAPSPYAGTTQCWQTAQTLLQREGLGLQLESDSQSPFLTAATIVDDRLTRVKVPPQQKLAVIIGLIDVALRGHTLAEDLIQGVERERQAKADICKERARLNKQWAELKAQKLASMPAKDSFLPIDGRPDSKVVAEEEARVVALTEWEAEMGEAELEHKKELRLSHISQYVVGAVNRLRFQPAGTDALRNVYYILGGTPGRLYPTDTAELAFAWSYSVVVHGTAPGGRSSGAEGEGAEETTGGRLAEDEWMRVSEPEEMRQLAAWIEYEARMVDYAIVAGLSSEAQAAMEKDPESGAAKALKSVAGLVDQIQTFAEYVGLKISERDEQTTERRALKSRAV